MNVDLNKVKGVSCIYSITNSINGLYYIGSAVDLKSRWKEHINTLNKNTHHNIRLQKDWNEYGKDIFNFDVVELVEKKKESLISREQWYLDFLKPYYNILRKADSRMGVPLSEETKRKLSLARAGKKLSPAALEAIRKVHQRKRGVPLSEATKNKLREAASKRDMKMFGEKNGFYKKTHTDEAKKKMSDSKKNSISFKEKLSITHSQNKDRFKGSGNPFFGKTHTEEVRKFLSEKAKNQIPPNLGKKMSDETKKKISETKKSQNRHHTEEFKKKLSERTKGIKFSEEHKARISAALKGRKKNKKQTII